MSTDHDHIRQWCLSLTVLTTVTISRDDLETKLAAYVPMLATEFPLAAFTPAALAHVARHCSRGFPSFGELCDHLSQHWRASRPPSLRLAAPEPPMRGPGRPPTDEERAYVRARVQEIETILRSPQAEPPPRPTPRHLTPEQLDQLNPLPEGQKRFR